MRSNKSYVQLTVALLIVAVSPLILARCAVAQEEGVLHSFGGSTSDGATPYAGLVSDGKGNLYGTTSFGGAGDCSNYGLGLGCGTVFELIPGTNGGWGEKLLHTFNNNGDGTNPYASLILDAAGNLYGTTFQGGTYGGGTVFELTPSDSGPWKEELLYSFGAYYTDGMFPSCSLVFDAAGNLYGTTIQGGAEGIHSPGTVFELTPRESGRWAEKLLYVFQPNAGDGYASYSGVVFDAAGNLYGTTTLGPGNRDVGAVFELTPAGKGLWTEKVLYRIGTSAGLVLDGAGNLYGTTGERSPYGYGMVFELTPTEDGPWTISALHFFEGTDGSLPAGSLTPNAAGNFYGTTKWGGSGACTYFGVVAGCGIVFRLMHEADGTWKERILYSFNDDGTGATDPFGSLVLDAAGNLYGTTSSGGAYGYGTVFEVKP